MAWFDHLLFLWKDRSILSGAFPRMDPYVLHSLLARLKSLGLPTDSYLSGPGNYHPIPFFKRVEKFDFGLCCTILSLYPQRWIWVFSWLWQTEEETSWTSSGATFWFFWRIIEDFFSVEMATAWVKVFDSICSWQHWLGLSRGVQTHCNIKSNLLFQALMTHCSGVRLSWKHWGCALHHLSLHQVSVWKPFSNFR